MGGRTDSAFQAGNMLVKIISAPVLLLNMGAVSHRRQGKDRILPAIEMRWEFETIKGFWKDYNSCRDETHDFCLEDVPEQCEAAQSVMLTGFKAQHDTRHPTPHSGFVSL